MCLLTNQPTEHVPISSSELLIPKTAGKHGNTFVQ